MEKELHVPFLRKGVGQTPRDGGCILQVIDWIDRAEWTDSPPCVHPVLRALAIAANDTLADSERSQLLVLASRLQQTQSDSVALSIHLAIWCAEYVLPYFVAERPGDSRPQNAIAAAKRVLANESNKEAAGAAQEAARAAEAAAEAAAWAAAWAVEAAARAAAWAAEAAAEAAARAAAEAAARTAGAAGAAGAANLQLLHACLDEYDRYTHRDSAALAPIDWTPVCEAMAP